MNQYKNKKGSTYTILKNFWKVILEDRDKVKFNKKHSILEALNAM